jgi:DNA-binding NarL/FixJ family response regulator
VARAGAAERCSAGESDMIRLLLADDHQIFRQGLKRLLADEPDFQIVAEAANGAEVVEAVCKHKLDVAILDLSMPGRDGVEMIAHVKSLQPTLRTLVLTMHGGSSYVMQALRAGTDGYMTKENACDELATAIRRLAAGGKYVCPLLAERLTLDSGRQQDVPNHLQLSQRERKVFEMLVAGKRGSEIAQELSLSEKTVSTHKAHVLKKMQVVNRTELVLYAIRYQLVAP